MEKINEYPNHIGGGNYKLSDGRTIKGKQRAIKAQNIISNNAFLKVVNEPAPGLTKRECFAMAAMQGLLSNPNIMDEADNEWCAKTAINQADELLKQLEILKQFNE